MQKIKRPIAGLTSITTIAWMCGLTMLAPMAAGAAVVDGSIVSPDAEFTEDGTTYYPYDVFIVKIVDGKTFKRLVLNPEVFESYGHLEWDDIQTIDASTVEGYTTSELVYPDNDGDGVADGSVYKLTPDGDTGERQHLDMTASEFEDAGYDWDSVYVVNSTDFGNYTEGDAITDGDDDDDDDVASDGTLTVSLAADTPAATAVPAKAARVPFTKVNLTATGGDVVVDSMTIERGGGMAQDDNFDSVNIVDLSTDPGETIATDKTLNSSHQATINDDVTIESGTTKSLMLVGNMASSVNAGEIPTLKLTAATVKDDATLNATLPITGNAMTMNGTISVATVTLGEGASNPDSDKTPKVGDTDVDFTEIKISNTSSDEAIELEQIKFVQYGSAGASDVENFDLVDSSTNTVLATVEKMNDDKEVVFNFDTALEIDKGKNKQLMIRGDIEGGAARTIQMKIDKFTDILAMGQLYGFYVTATAGTNARSTEPVFGADTVVYEQTIGEGSLKVTQSSLAAANIAEGADEVTLGAFDFVVKGEPITISKIGWQTYIDLATDGTSATTSDITNLTIYDEDGNSVAGPMDPTHDYGDGGKAYGSATTTDSFTVPVGTNTYTVKADLSSDFSADDTIAIKITPDSNITATGDVTSKTVDPTPSSIVSSATMTVKTGALYVSLDPTVSSTSVVQGTNDFVFAKLVLNATASGEDINVSQVKVRVEPGTASADELSNFTIYDGDTALDVTNDPDSALSSDADTKSTSTFSLADTLVVESGESKTLTVKADISLATETNDTFKVGISDANISATGASTGSSISPTYSASDGATITIQNSGSLTVYASSATPSAGLITADTSGVEVGVFNATASYEDINIEKIYFTTTRVNSGGLDQVDTFYLYDEDGALIKSVTPTSTDSDDGNTVLVDMSSDPLVIEKGTSEDVTIEVDTAPAYRYPTVAGLGQAGQGFKFSINATGDITAKGASSGVAVSSKTVSCAMKEMTVYHSVPTVTLNEDMSEGITSGSFTDGTVTGKELYKFKVAADSKGDIGLYRASFLITTSTATVTPSSMYITDGTETVAKWGEIDTAQYVQVDDNDDGGSAIYNFYFTDDQSAPDDATLANATNVISYTVAEGNEKTFTLKGTVKCTSDGGCSGSSGNGSLQIQFLGDSSWPSIAGSEGYPDGADELDAENYENSFIWGDYNITGGTSSTTASSSEQWTNGYRVASGSGGTLVATSSSVTFSN